MSANVWEALARELRELKRLTESLRDQVAAVEEKLPDISARIEEARKGANGGKGKETEGGVSDF